MAAKLDEVSYTIGEIKADVKATQTDLRAIAERLDVLVASAQKTERERTDAEFRLKQLTSDVEAIKASARQAGASGGKLHGSITGSLAALIVTLGEILWKKYNGP